MIFSSLSHPSFFSLAQHRLTPCHRVCIVSWLITANMATPVEKIAKLEADIEVLNSKRNSTSNEDLQIAITREITVIREQIVQQGKYVNNLFFLSVSNSVPQSHLHIGLPFGTSIPCLQLEQVLIRLVSFLQYVHVVSLTISVHEGTTKLFPVFFKDCFTFHLFAFTVLFSSFSIALLCTPITSPTRMPFGTPIPCLQLEQVMIRLETFSPTLRVFFFTISVHEGTTKLFPVWDGFTFHLFPFVVLFSSFFIALLYTPIASPCRMPFETPFRPCRQSR